ncbi:MAG: GNAT family N-acetyltransferase [Planctomycetes bacterium]|nr:GNAT family N-acetyltransferase [Planctomycetota bacterium]
MNIEVVNTEAGWDAMEREWDPLVERSASATVFLTWEWLRPWWRHFGRPGDELAILAARDGTALVGIAPLYRSRVRASYGVGSLRRLGFIGDHSGDSEYLDFITEPGREEEVLRAFLAHIEADRAGWDLAQFWLVPAASPHLALLRRFAVERRWLAEERQWPCLSIRLPADWESYLATLQPRFRSKLRSLLRKLPEGPVGGGSVPRAVGSGEDAGHGGPAHSAVALPAFDQCIDPAELPERLESLFALHQERWRAEGKPGSFASEGRRGFYREMGEAFLRRGWLRFHALRLGGRFAAHEFSFEHLGRVYFLQQAYDIGREDLNLGTALKAHVIRESIARGACEYDFLGGDAPYKRKWGTERRECAFLTLARPTVRARIHLGLPRLARRLRDGARALTPGPLLRLKRRVQTWLGRCRSGIPDSKLQIPDGEEARGETSPSAGPRLPEICNRQSAIGNRLSVALVNRFFHRAGAVPSVVREWADHLEAAGHEVVVFASDVEAAPRQCGMRDAECGMKNGGLVTTRATRTCVPVRLGRRRVFDEAGLAFAWRLRRAVLDFTPHSALRTPHSPFDVLLCTDSTAYFGAWRACRRLGIPAIMAFQGWVYSPGKRGLYPRTVTWVYKRAVHFCARRAPLIACISQEIYDGFRGLGVPAERLWLAPNCVDPAAWDTGKAGAHRRAERRLLFVGRFSPEKGLRYFLEALPAIVARFPQVRALLVGTDEPEDGEFHQMARRLGVAERVAFGGIVPREALPKMYAEADLLVVPSLGEGHPLAPVECLASGTPVVASDLPGLRQTIRDGVTGQLVPPGDPKALAEAIYGILADAEALDRMSRAARPSIEPFLWERRIAEFEALAARLRQKGGQP